MARFGLEIISACGKIIGFNRIGLRLSPGGHMSGIVTDYKDQFIYQHLLKELNKIPIAYIHTGIFDDSMVFSELDGLTATSFLRKYYSNTV